MSRVLLVAVLTLLIPSQGASDVSAPVWAKRGHFWFAKAVTGGHLYFTVDAINGAKEPLFDHQRLATELNLRTGYEFTPLTLPFVDAASQFAVKYDGRNAYIQEGAMAVEFALDGMHWRCELQIKWDWNKVPPTDYECTPRRPAFAPSPLRRDFAVVSPDGRYAASIRGHNVWLTEVGGVGGVGGVGKVLTKDGTADFAWDAGSLTWSADSRSVTGYRLHADIWRSPSITANVKKLVQMGSWTVPR
jgi:hypothetical protein